MQIFLWPKSVTVFVWANKMSDMYMAMAMAGPKKYRITSRGIYDIDTCIRRPFELFVVALGFCLQLKA